MDCTFIVSEEKKLGRKLTKKEQIKLLFDANLIDKLYFYCIGSCD